MNYLITGGNGLLGSHLCEELKNNNQPVKALIRKTADVSFLNSIEVPFVFGDVRSKNELLNAFEGVDIVIHAAAFTSDWGAKKEFLEINYTGTRNVLEACVEKKVKRLIFISSVEIFGKGDEEITENSPLKDTPGWYGKTKKMAEELVRKYIQDNKLDITIIYPSWIYGERDRAFVPELVKAIKSGSMLFFRNKGKHWLYCVYIKNLTDAIFYLIHHNNSIGEGYIVTDEKPVLFKDFVNTIAKKNNCKEVRLSIPYSLALSVAVVMEFIYKLFAIKSRPLLTRQAVATLAYKTTYSNDKLYAAGFKHRYDFVDVVNRLFQNKS